MKQLIGLVLTTLLISACASLPVKQTATVDLQASETALEAAHNAERAFCSPTADKSVAVTHCDGEQATAVGLTDARHQEVARAFAKAFTSEIDAATVLKTWKAGDPKPASLAQYRADLDAVLTLVSQLIPTTQPAVTKIQDAITEVTKVATTLGAR